MWFKLLHFLLGNETKSQKDKMNNIDTITLQKFNKGINIVFNKTVYKGTDVKTSSTKVRIGLRGGKDLYEKLGAVLFPRIERVEHDDDPNNGGGWK